MKKGLCVLIVCICSVHVSAQTFRETYDAFKKQSEEEYTAFRDKVNREYEEFMRKAWEEFRVMPAIPRPTIPDPPVPPVVLPEEDEDKKPEDNLLPYDEVIPVIPVVIEQPKPVAPIPEEPQPKVSNYTFDIYGTSCTVRLGERNRFSLKKCDENSIADAWRQMCMPNFNNLIRDCLTLRIQHGLCDWAYLQLLEKLSTGFFGNDTNEAVLLQAYLYNQSGYKMRLAYADDRLYLLVASKHSIYNWKYYIVDDERYYPLHCNIDRLYICEAAYPNEQPLSLLIPNEQSFTLKISGERELQSRKYPAAKATVSSNENLIHFFDSYPSSDINYDFGTRWAFYACTPLSSWVKERLYPPLELAIKGKSEQEAANILINFVQTAFVYGYDDEIWGGDRPFFAEETLYYPYSDCEDRAILFSRLVRDLLGLEVVLIYYPGHLATAVHFTEVLQGDHIIYKDKRYLICDPTYIGASVGLTMPGMDNVKAKVILLN